MKAAASVAAWTALAASAMLAAGRGVWIDVPFVAQTRNACGAANAAMLLRYWAGKGVPLKGADASLDQLHARLYSAEERGALGSELAEALEEAGLRTFTFEGGYADLNEHLAQGRPLIVCLKPRGQARLHFVLVVGLDPGADVVLVNDPARRKLSKMDRGEFLSSWASAGHWALLAVPRRLP